MPRQREEARHERRRDVVFLTDIAMIGRRHSDEAGTITLRMRRAAGTIATNRRHSLALMARAIIILR